MCLLELNELDKAEEDFKMFEKALKPQDQYIAQEYLDKVALKRENNKLIERKTFKNFFQNTKYDEKSIQVQSLPIPSGPMSYEHSHVFFDFSINETDIGRVEFELFSKYVPLTSANFRSLCLGDTIDKNGIALCYKFSPIHRIVKGLGIIGGDITNFNGTGGRSIYSHTFDDENFIYSHEQPYLLSMFSNGPNSNGSMFIITTGIEPAMDGRNVVFGKVIRGVEILQKIEEEELSDERPIDTISISNCGVLFN